MTLVDFMTLRSESPLLGRRVSGIRGQVQMNLELVIRFDYGSVVPWVRRTGHGISAIAGPDMLALHTKTRLRGENLKTVATFTVAKGPSVAFDLVWYPSHSDEPLPVNIDKEIHGTERWWHEWSDRCVYRGEWRDAVLRSLVTLKALTFCPPAVLWLPLQRRFPSWWEGKELGLSFLLGAGCNSDPAFSARCRIPRRGEGVA